MATILRSRVAWAKPRDPTATRRSYDLTPEERTNASAAIRFLAKRHGTVGKLTLAMGAKRRTVLAAMSRRRCAVSAGLALRAARVAGVPLEDVLAGRWPVAGACPHCGRT
jgi:hypothetical protein